MPPQVSQPEAWQTRKPRGTGVKVRVFGQLRACLCLPRTSHVSSVRDARIGWSAGSSNSLSRIGILLRQLYKTHCNKRVFRLFTRHGSHGWRFLQGKEMRFKLYMGYTEASSPDEENQEPGIFLRARGLRTKTLPTDSLSYSRRSERTCKCLGALGTSQGLQS